MVCDTTNAERESNMIQMMKGAWFGENWCWVIYEGGGYHSMRLFGMTRSLGGTTLQKENFEKSPEFSNSHIHLIVTPCLIQERVSSSSSSFFSQQTFSFMYFSNKGG